MALKKTLSQDSFPKGAYDEKHPTEDSIGQPQTRATRNRAICEAAEKGDLYSLRELSRQPGGFQDARSVAWPFLLHVRCTPEEVRELEEEESGQDGQSSAPPRSPHRDERQVGLDTNRAFVHYPVESQQCKEKRKKQLTELILNVLQRHPQLSYFQGYHDILSTLQLTLHPSLEKDAKAWHLLRECALKITLHRARDAMGVGLEPLTGQLRILRRLIRLADPELAILIEDASPLPYWAISPLMTLYTHDLPTLALAQRVMDWVLARPPDAVIYLVATFVLRKKAEIQKLVDDGDDGMMHAFLSSLPELEADELPDPFNTHDQLSSPHAPSELSTTNLSSSTYGLCSSKESWVHSSVSPVEPPPYADEFPLEPQAQDAATSVDPPVIRAMLAPPSPASSLSSLPPQEPSIDHRGGPTIPLSQVLQEADRLRTKYPIFHTKLRLEETLGPHSMLRTWPDDLDEIIGDDTAEEYVLATDQIVYPDMDDDVFEPYPPPSFDKPSNTRLTRLPKLNMALALGLPMAAVMFAVASNSPTTRAQLKQGTAFAWNFAEVGFGYML
ncbi:Rab-GTPase-TBC domain protein [Rhizoctonia solani AG-3 Rhs1AP]|uniref:Rab-GTPase-TBC domain protein n=2 Tax=Rhizoctonia solani AG-3 TaxID=1086053 RepID=A0A074SVP3_9AGAM|nr:Rab-GTPase-TBC domain protein [Rhizoctonia solani AG-3 Rhs1AP]KEP53977.1 Rab-GTPase-TBC domain protein [Rhizoctonia solani 123E]